MFEKAFEALPPVAPFFIPCRDGLPTGKVAPNAARQLENDFLGASFRSFFPLSANTSEASEAIFFCRVILPPMDVLDPQKKDAAAIGARAKGLNASIKNTIKHNTTATNN